MTYIPLNETFNSRYQGGYWPPYDDIISLIQIEFIQYDKFNSD
jgi:hypothetical protein